MWPPAPRPGYHPYPHPNMRPSLHSTLTFGNPAVAHHNTELIQPQPFIHLGNAPPWHQKQNENSWKPLEGMDSWKIPRQNNPWSNHEICRHTYSQLPRSLHHSQFALFEQGLPNKYQFDNLTTPKLPDYEKQLKEHYEKPQNIYSDFSINKIELHAELSARKILLTWRLPTLPDQNEKYKINLIVKLEELEGGIGRGARKGEFGSIFNKILPIHVTRTEFDTIPGSLYYVELNIIGQRDNSTIATAKISERAAFSLDEMKVLMQKALNFTGTNMHQYTFLYRCKPKIYWDYLYNERGQVMHTYTKDSNGQAATPINQNINGLFFSARTNPDGSLPISSPFGDIRMVIPAMTLLDPSKVNLYFADFYCNRVTHYVTVVVTIPGSSSDSFCKKKLIRLDPFENLFLRFQTTSNPNVPLLYFVNKKVWVEIFYTENVSMRWGRFDNIMAAGVGTSKIGGLPHNKHCRICNLYPIGVPAANQPPVQFTPIPKEKAEIMINEAINAQFVDLDNSDDEFESLFDDRQKRNEEFLSYGELKNRLNKLEQQIIFDSKRSNRSGNLLKELTKNINNFMREVDNDFSILSSNIGILEKKTQIEAIEEVNHENQTISETVDALIDSSAGSHLANKRRKRSNRINKLSSSFSVNYKRRRESL